MNWNKKMKSQVAANQKDNRSDKNEVINQAVKTGRAKDIPSASKTMDDLIDRGEVKYDPITNEVTLKKGASSVNRYQQILFFISLLAPFTF